jgi:hypothetical protein
MFVGELVELLAATVMGRLDGVAGLIPVLPVITKKRALAAGGAERSGIGPMRLAGMRGTDLMIEFDRVAGRQVR